MKKILVMYGSIGLGHKVVAENITVVLKTYPDVKIEMLDVLEMYRGPFTETSSRIYKFIVDHIPGLWGFFYTNPIFLKASLPFRVPLAGLKIKKFRDYFNRSKPDLILFFHFQPYWVYPRVDKYLVMTPEQADEVGKRGFARSQVLITGLPVHPVFSEEYHDIVVRREFGFHSNRPIVLMIGGSRGWGIKIADIWALLGSAYDMELVVVAGFNSELLADLQKLRETAGSNLKVLGNLETSAVAKLCAVAKVLVTKPGGLSLAQGLLRGLPMVLVNPLPAMEELNTRYLIRYGAAVVARSSAELKSWVERILQDRKFCQGLKANSLKLANPKAAATAAAAVIDTLSGSDNMKMYGPVIKL
ncbi:MAG: hypothetical protein UY73_C0042G0006 [Parcubacteria group bacterium GW2011_GWA2_52_8]|nr:MAG: hypothetical protein UY73_C0042G0006 [Parcubacteria group bacterium GW2011_GWA2_52_8]